MTLDTQCLKRLSSAEKVQYEATLEDARSAVEPAQKEIIKQYFDVEAPKLMEAAKKEGKDLSLEDAQKTVQARCEGGKHRDLFQDDRLHFDDEKVGFVSVSEALKNPEKVNGKSLRDPQEPELGRGKAKFFANGKEEKPFIYSFAHGGIKYFPHDVPVGTEIKKGPTPKEDNWSYEDIICHLHHIKDKRDNGGEITDNSKIFGVVTDMLEHQDLNSLQLNHLREILKAKFKINKATIDLTLNWRKNSLKSDAEKKKDEESTHIEIADKFIENRVLERSLAPVGVENSFWDYVGSTYQETPLSKIELKIAREHDGKLCKRGSDYKSIAKLAYTSVEKLNFFRNAPIGLSGATQFYQVEGDKVTAQDYSPEIRARWQLKEDPAPVYSPEKAPLFQPYLDFALPDEQQQKLLQEVVGALITAQMSSLQRAALLIGPGNNGKSVLLDLLSHIFPPELKCAIKPDKMSEDYFKAMLAGKMINIVGETDVTQPIKSDFKDVVAADTPLTARLPYNPPFEFLPQAGHIFSSNGFPMTKDHSFGFYRRWVIIEFKNKVTPEMKIPRLGQKIAENEMSQVLAWALEGAQRLIQNNFQLTQTTQHTALMKKWQNIRDSVFNFLNDDEAVQYVEGAYVYKTSLYKVYSTWAKYNAGVRPVGRNAFYERAALKLSEKRINNKRAYVGVAVCEWIEGAGLLQCPEAAIQCFVNEVGVGA